MLGKLSRVIIASSAATALFASATFAQVGKTPTSQNLGGPTLKIITPQEGQTIYGDKLPTLLTVENFSLVDYQTYKNRLSGQGHIHLWLDDSAPTKESAVKIFSEDFTYSDVLYGNHTLVAELVANDHNSLNPKVTTTVNFKTEPVGTPAPIATSGFDKNTALVIFVVVAIVILAAWWYTKEEDEEGQKEEAKPKTKKKTAKKRPSKRKKST